MRDSVARIRRDPEDHAEYVRQNERFHNLVGEASESPILRLYSGSLQSIADGGMVGFRYAAKQRLATADFHLEITEKISVGDPEGAHQSMADHLVEAGNFWQHRHPEGVTRPIRWLE